AHEAERVAVLVGAGDGLVAERAGGPRPVFDHHRLTELLLQRLADDAADDVGAAARPERNDDAYGPLRPVIAARGTRGANQCDGGDGEQAASREHGLSSFGARPLRAAAVIHVAEFSFPRKRQSVVAILALMLL